MAIGDAIAAILGTATTNRQPASGVEEQISCVIKHGANDQVNMYDGTNLVSILEGTTITSEDVNNANQTPINMLNVAIMITNTIYIRKSDVTDRCYIGGVQTNV
jgi:hypothetical protein